jgi:hypothetical protein
LAQSYPPNWDIRSDDRFNELPSVTAPRQLLGRFLIETLPERENISQAAGLFLADFVEKVFGCDARRSLIQ